MPSGAQARDAAGASVAIAAGNDRLAEVVDLDARPAEGLGQLVHRVEAFLRPAEADERDAPANGIADWEHDCLSAPDERT